MPKATDIQRVIKPNARGEDVRKLIEATDRRLGALGLDSLKLGGKRTTNTQVVRSRVRLVLQSLGALPETRKKVSTGINQAMQRMVRYPETRSSAQVRRAIEFKHSDAYRTLLKKEPVAIGETDALRYRRRIEAAASWAFAKCGPNYTQGPRRWDPINSHAGPDTGKAFAYGDCSSVATWMQRYALGWDHADIINGTNWQSGYTGTQVVHGRRLPSGVVYEPGDMAFYGTGTMSHVVVCWKAGSASTARWLSYGSQGAPYDVAVNYRYDLNHVRRYVD